MALRRIKPLPGRVLLERSTPPEVSRGGLILPSSARDLSALATIISTGPNSQVKEGEVAVLPPSVDYRRFSLDGKEVELLDESDILATITIEKKKEKRR